MKTLKSLFNGLYILVAVFACALVFSCNSGLSGVSDSGKKTESNGKAYISSVSLGNGERAIVPNGSFALKGEEIYMFVLSKVNADNGELEELGRWKRTNDDCAYDVMDEALRSGALPLDPGTYTFEIKVYVSGNGGAVYEGDDAEEATDDDDAILVLEKTSEPMSLVAGSNKIRFGILNEAKGEGFLSLTVSFPDEGVKNVKVTLTPKDEGNTYSATVDSLEISEPVGGYRKVTFNNNPNNGWYLVNFTFTINNGVKDTTQTWSELVQIATGRQTKGEISIDSLNTLYPISYNCKGGHLRKTQYLFLIRHIQLQSQCLL